MTDKIIINLQQLLERNTITTQIALEDRRLVSQLARQQEFSYLYEIALAIEHLTKEERGDTFDRARSATAQHYLEKLYQSIEQVLFTLRGGIDTLIDMARIRPVFLSYSFAPGWQRERYYASRIVAYQQPNDVLAAMERHATNEKDFEMLFLLAHELVLQAPANSNGLSNHPLMKRLHQQMRAQAHPLGWLPLYKTTLEQEITGKIPLFGASEQPSYEFALTHWQSGGHEPGIPPTSEGVYAHIQRMSVTNDSAYRAICSAVLNWMVESNGRFEAHCVAFSVPFPQELFTPSMLVGFGFEALDGVDEADITFQPISAHETYSILFRSAAIGGDIRGGCFGAYGRLYAWQSLAGLTGVPAGASIEAICEVAQQSTCCYVWAPSQWFYQIVTEFGLFVLRPDRRSGAFLAATDTD